MVRSHASVMWWEIDDVRCNWSLPSPNWLKHKSRATSPNWDGKASLKTIVGLPPDKTVYHKDRRLSWYLTRSPSSHRLKFGDTLPRIAAVLSSGFQLGPGILRYVCPALQLRTQAETRPCCLAVKHFSHKSVSTHVTHLNLKPWISFLGEPP